MKFINIIKIKVQTSNAQYGLGKFYQLFKDDYEKIIDEMNEVLVA
jgi:hypothetical protein